MRIRVDDLPEAGLEVEAGMADRWAREAVAEAVGAPPEALELHANVTKIAGHVRVEGELDTSFMADCDRCAASLRVHLSGPFDLYYAPPLPSEEVERALRKEDLDIGFYDGSGLDLSAVLSEQAALALPSRLRCGENGAVRVDSGECRLPGEEVEPLAPGRHRPFAKLLKS